MKEKNLNSDDQQFLQYQQSVQSPLILTPCTYKKPTTYDIGIHVMDWDRHKTLAGLNQFIGSPPLHNGFSNGSVLVNKIQQETLPYTCIYILEKRVWYVRPISGFHRYTG